MSRSQKDNQKPFAIVVGLDGMNGIQTARILASRGVPVIAIARDPNHYCCRTKVCEKILFADTSTEDFIQTLEDLGPQLMHKAVLFPCTDMNVLLISRHRQRLSEWYHIVLPKPDIVEKMMDKVGFYTYAQENGFPIPATRFLHSREEAEQISKELTFPCVIKPPISSTPEWELQSKLKAYKVTSPEEVLAIYDSYGTLTDELIIQEWIVGSSSSLYSCNCYFDANSEPVVTFIARKIRQWPPHIGESCLGEECRDDIVLHETVRLLKSVNYRGLGYVEFKRDERNGKYYIMEPNIGRPTGRSAIAEAGGVELVYTMYCDALGWPLPNNRVQSYGSVKWIFIRRDLQSALYQWQEGNLTLREWWQSVRGPKTYALFSWNDLGPFIGDLQRSFHLYLSAEEREKRNYKNL